VLRETIRCWGMHTTLSCHVCRCQLRGDASYWKGPSERAEAAQPLPVTQEFQAILHRIGVKRVCQVQQPPHQVTNRELAGYDDTGMAPSLLHPCSMYCGEVADIESDKRPPL
jgi:hypothetical protein